MEWLTTTAFAHRGLHAAGVPENSLAAFEAAVDSGYGIELDVRLTADDEPVVFHDETLSRLTDGAGAVSDQPLSAIRSLRINDSTARIPRLSEVLAAVDGAVPLLIELKPDDASTDLVDAISGLLDAYAGAFAVQSFDPLVLRRVRRRYPSWPRGQLAAVFDERDDIPWYRNAVCKRLLLNWVSRPDYISYRHTDLAYWPVSLARRMGLPIHAWTVRSDDELQAARRYADTVLFEEMKP